MNSEAGKVLVVGCEPAAFSACFSLIENGLEVVHVRPETLGLSGSSRDIGLAYPELGEPWERLEHAIGGEVALEFHQWSKLGIEDLSRRFPDQTTRGSRLSVTRTEQESKLMSEDALKRGKAPVSDEVRLMSGAAASNYAPIDGADLCAFETHALSFVPVALLNTMAEHLEKSELYQAIKIEKKPEDSLGKVTCTENSVAFENHDQILARGDLAIVAHGLGTSSLIGHLKKALTSILAQAFRSSPLKEKTRSSVQGITASWGYERYKFDSEFRLLGCGIDPTRAAEVGEEATVDNKVMERFAKRASQLFTDLEPSTENFMKWGVQFTGSCDGLPVLGPLPGEPRIQVAAGFSTAAWSRGWYAGHMLGQAISGASTPTALFNRCTSRRFLRR